MIRRPPSSTLFPSPPLFRSGEAHAPRIPPRRANHPPRTHLAPNQGEPDPASPAGDAALGHPGEARHATDVAVEVRDGGPAGGGGGGRLGVEQEAPQGPVGVPAEVQPRRGFLAGVAALGAGDAAPLVVANLLWERLILDPR